MTLCRGTLVFAAVLGGAVLLGGGALLWIGTAKLWAVNGTLMAVLPDGWETLSAGRTGQPDLLEKDLREAMGAAGLQQADVAGIALRQAYGTVYAVVPYGFESEYFDLMAGCWVNLQPIALVRGPGGAWKVGRVHCVAGRPPVPPQDLG